MKVSACFTRFIIRESYVCYTQMVEAEMAFGTAGFVRSLTDPDSLSHKVTMAIAAGESLSCFRHFYGWG